MELQRVKSLAVEIARWVCIVLIGLAVIVIFVLFFLKMPAFTPPE